MSQIKGQKDNFAHDALSRVSSTSCGTSWNQQFTYDPFGNITKTTSGPGISFTPTYDATKNWITAVPGITTTTDADGRMTYDGAHNYGWDVEGKMVSVDSTTVTYDALGRMVETASGSTYTQVVYSPLGRLALMNGQTLGKAFVPLPTGATAVYTSSGLAYYRHHDHLGSSRLASTPSRTLYAATAYAPFGEPYAQAGTTDLSFTGQDQDTVPGMHDFLMRKLVPVQGRWLSPDPSGLASADPASPQSLNRYAYVMNNPLTFTDPLGLFIYFNACMNEGKGANCGGGGGGGCDPNVMNCMGGAGTGYSGSGSGGIDQGGDANGFDWNLEPGSFGGSGLPSGAGALQAGVSRYLSIINKGWDPALGIQYTEYSFTGGDGSTLEKQRELAAIAFGEQACAGQEASAIADCIQQVYNALALQANPAMEGGNYDFSYADAKGNLLIQINGQFADPHDFVGCSFSRCGAFDSLDYSHSGYTFHVDTANPFFFPIGTATHIVVDLLGGHTWWSGGIPRFP